jgi:hypothetical protein
MAKQMTQDIVVNKDRGNEGKEPPVEILPRKTAVAADDVKGAIEEPLPPPKREEKGERSGGGPAFPPIETSPIFEKMKQHNKDRGKSFSDEYTADKKRGGRRMFGKLVLALCVIGIIGAFLYGLYFHSAVLTITLKHADVALQNQEFTAGGVPADGAAAVETLPFQMMALSLESSAELTATGEKNVTAKASGKIVVYNDFGTQTQPLIKNTRFQTPDGKIYRIRNSIVVPGQKTVDGKKIPGSLEVEVFADAAGAEYNIGLVDFTIPGFKGSPRYEKFYARSKTPMEGGFSGLMKVVSDTDIRKAKETLTAELKDKLFADAVAQKPKGTVLYKDAVFYGFSDSMDNNAAAKSPDDKSVKLIMKGSLTAVLFNEEELSKHIVKRSVSPVDVSSSDRILAVNIEELAFKPKDTSGVAPKEGDTYAFSLSGDAHAVWQVDTAALAGKLAGMKKSDYKNVFAEFPGIEKANASVRPIWKTKFPSDAAKIRVEVSAE